jgi:sulfur carrier protein ThiS adenylyltransferase
MDDGMKKDIADILAASSVGVAGLGGLGSNVAMALARAGVGRLVLVDFDRVEGKNLNRQAYFSSQVGELKTVALRENILAANPDTDVKTVGQRLTPGSMAMPFSDVDVVVEALDNAETKARFIEEVLVALPRVPLVAASGVAGIGGSERIRLRRSGNLYLIHDDDALSSDDDVLLAPRVGLFAHWQSNLVLEILLEGRYDD